MSESLSYSEVQCLYLVENKYSDLLTNNCQRYET